MIANRPATDSLAELMASLGELDDDSVQALILACARQLLGRHGVDLIRSCDGEAVAVYAGPHAAAAVHEAFERAREQVTKGVEQPCPNV